MKINRHNYEEYFILYMDNELSSDDRRMVEAFVVQHPDLKEELELLQQFKLEPDTAVTYAGKEELMKMNGSSPVTLTNYDEWLVLYIDNELTAGQKIKVEKFLAENPAINAELSLYKRSKLQPETIVFANKESLYRKEEKVRRITPIWWRVAAAVLLVIVGTTVILVNNKSKGDKKDDLATTTPGTEKKTTPVQQPEQTNTENPVAVVKEQDLVTPDNTNTNSEAVKQPNNAVAVKNNNTVPKNKTQENLVIQPKKEETAIAVNNNNKPNNNLPKPTNNPYINDNNATGERVIASVSDPVNNTKKNDVLTKTNVTTPKVQPSDNIVAASFTNNDDQLNEQPDGKKNKLRGFFRKITRTFEKRTNMEATDDDGKLLVAGLAIKLK